MKKSLIFLCLVLLSSCFLLQEKGIDFKVVNNSDVAITKVKISTSENLDSIIYTNISVNESREGFLSMKNNKKDGSYTITYTKADGNVVKESAGYYTNGGSLDSWIRFEIKNDTTLIKLGDFPKN